MKRILITLAVCFGLGMLGCPHKQKNEPIPATVPTVEEKKAEEPKEEAKKVDAPVAQPVAK